MILLSDLLVGLDVPTVVTESVHLNSFTWF